MRAGLLVGAAVSLLVHGLVVGGVAALVGPGARKKTKIEPLELLPAPPPPAPPEMPKEPPPPPAKPSAPPSPQRPPRPRIKKPPRPVPAADAGPIADAAVGELDAGPDAGARDAGRDARDAGDAGAGDAGAGDGDAGADGGEGTSDGGTGDGGTGDGGTGDGGPVGAPIDPGVVDLRPFLPPGERVMLVLRADRLRATPWGARFEPLVAPMPDHRLVLEGTGLGIVDTFDVVVISSAEPRDVTRTFLAARSALDGEALKRALARPAPGGTGPRLRWTGDAAERIDPRVARLNDPRQLRVPSPGWFMLVRPEHLADGQRGWLDALPRIDEQTGNGPTVAVVMVANLGTPTLDLPVPGLPPLPAPDHLTTAVTVERAGLVLTGAAVFPDEAAARGFVEALEKARAQALDSLGGRVVLRSFHLEGAIRRLAFVRRGPAVTFSTSLANDEAEAFLGVLVEMSQRFFLGRTPK